MKTRQNLGNENKTKSRWDLKGEDVQSTDIIAKDGTVLAREPTSETGTNVEATEANGNSESTRRAKRRSRWDQKCAENDESITTNTQSDEALDPNGVYQIPTESKASVSTLAGPEVPSDLSFLKGTDLAHFGVLLGKDEKNEKLTSEEQTRRRILRLILRVKNGHPSVRKAALRQITENARQFGAHALFDALLPILMDQRLDEQERHLLVKIVDRVLYRLDDLVRPYTHKILVVVEPLLVDQSYLVRAEGREIISNLAKAAGLPTMIATIRPDIDHDDEFVRDITSKAFAIVASALGIQSSVQFISAVCRSKKSWKARHTGLKIVHQVAFFGKCSILPHLQSLVDCVAPNLTDDNIKVRTAAASAVSELASAASPYGIEYLDTVVNDIVGAVSKNRGRQLVPFLKASGSLVSLMDFEQAQRFARSVVPTLLREFESPNDEMKRAVLHVTMKFQSCGVAKYAFSVLEFMKAFVTRQNSIEKRMAQLVLEACESILQSDPAAAIVYLTPLMKDESESFRKLCVQITSSVVSSMSIGTIDNDQLVPLIDSLLFAFQEQPSDDDSTTLNGLASVINSLVHDIGQFLPQIISSVLWRLNNKSAKARQQAADLIALIATTIKACGQDELLVKLGLILYEHLGEEYPDVLASIVAALRSILSVMGMSQVQPPIHDLLPRLTPILRNRHEKVQENTIDLVGRIADKAPDHISAREWLRIAFELLDMLKAHKKGIRRAAVNTFGYIAKAIGPQDVLALLLTNLKVQERQNRVCTTVAIAIVAETCAPFTVVPALMADYLTPELNVQNGVLKSLSFMFEYIDDLSKDYVYAVTPLLENALTDRDQVHRQTASTVVKHMALATAGLGLEDAMTHLLNLVWPNILEESPHTINAVRDAIDALCVNLGVGVILNYLLCGLFHPSRKVRTAYWAVYNNAYVQHADAMVAYYPKSQRDDLSLLI